MVLLRAVALAALLSTSAVALDTSKLRPRGYVNDFAGAIDANSAQALEIYCGNVETATGAQMAIVRLSRSMAIRSRTSPTACTGNGVSARKARTKEFCCCWPFR